MKSPNNDFIQVRHVWKFINIRLDFRTFIGVMTTSVATNVERSHRSDLHMIRKLEIGTFVLGFFPFLDVLFVLFRDFFRVKVWCHVGHFDFFGLAESRRHGGRGIRVFVGLCAFYYL